MYIAQNTTYYMHPQKGKNNDKQYTMNGSYGKASPSTFPPSPMTT